jgi:hypothetical protein
MPFNTRKQSFLFLKNLGALTINSLNPGLSLLVGKLFQRFSAFITYNTLSSLLSSLFLLLTRGRPLHPVEEMPLRFIRLKGFLLTGFSFAYKG